MPIKNCGSMYLKTVSKEFHSQKLHCIYCIYLYMKYIYIYTKYKYINIYKYITEYIYIYIYICIYICLYIYKCLTYIYKYRYNINIISFLLTERLLVQIISNEEIEGLQLRNYYWKSEPFISQFRDTNN